MDKVILGDNQFFGINHMSEHKAQAQAERFQKLESILDVIDIAYDAGIRGFMFNTHERVAEVCDYIRAHPTRYSDLRLYPSLPYAHKYANAVNENGLVNALNQFVLSGSSAGDIASTLARGTMTAVKRDLFEVMRILVDVELKMFRDLNVQVIFLQNIVADLLLGFQQAEVFSSFSKHVRNRYGVDAGINTMNLPAMVDLLEKAGVRNPIVCSSINQIGYMMCPDVSSYEATLREKEFRPIAMSILASGAIPVREAVDYVVGNGVDSIVFGASSKAHIVDTRNIIESAFDRLGEKTDDRPAYPKTVDSTAVTLPSPVTVRGIPVHSVEHSAALEIMESNIVGSRSRQHICITNTESMYHALRIPEHFDYISESALSLCDGIGISIAGKMAGKEIRRFNGPILVEKSVEYGVSRGWRHFFCGGRDGVAEQMSQNLMQRFPGVEIAGTYCPPFRDLTIAEERDMINAINDAKPDIVWVGLGLIKQEAWIRRYKKQLDVPWLVGVGAAFDYHAGTAKWAPKWIQKIGFEWLYRLFNEPRMFWRNVKSFAFLSDAMLYESIRGRRQNQKP